MYFELGSVCEACHKMIADGLKHIESHTCFKCCSLRFKLIRYHQNLFVFKCVVMQFIVHKLVDLCQHAILSLVLLSIKKIIVNAIAFVL